MEIKDLFIIRLKLLMDNQRINQKELAQAVGVSRPAISQFIAGSNRPSLDIFIKIADYLKVSLDYLAGTNDVGNLLFSEPSGELYYYFSQNKIEPPLHGALRYDFGIFRNADSLCVKFLVIKDKTGGTLVPLLYHSISHLYFLSLVSLLNGKLHFQYNPFNRSNYTDILIEIETGGGDDFQGVKIEPIRSAHLYPINYSSFVKEYLQKPITEKIEYLSNFINLPNIWK